MKLYNFTFCFFCWLILPVFAAPPSYRRPISLPKFQRTSLNRDDYGTVSVKRRVETMLVDIFNGKERSNEDSRGNSLQRRLFQTDKQGTLVRCEQFYKGVNVYGGEVIAKRNNETKTITLLDKESSYLRRKVELPPFQRISGTFFDSNGDAPAQIPLEDFNTDGALQRMKDRYLDSVQNGRTMFSLETVKLVVYTDLVGQPTLAYSVSFLAECMHGTSITRPHYIVDAQTDEILAEWDEIRSSEIRKIAYGPGGNEKLGRFNYGTDRPHLEVNMTWSNSTGWMCIFHTHKVVTMQYNWHADDPYMFKYCKQEGDMINGAYSPMNDAHFYATRTAEMFEQYYDPLKEPLKPIIVVAHDWTLKGNAVWTGRKVRLGVGNEHYFPFSSSMDIVSHEIAHGVTQTMSKLNYREQAGSLDESFSDITAKAVQRFDRKRLNWKFGYDVVRDVNGTLRCMDNPKCDGYSISHIRNYSYWTRPHQGSGIFNKVFYHLSQKTKYDVWDAYDIFYVANREFWTPTTTFLEAAEGILQAMYEMRQGKHLHYQYTHLRTGDAIDALKTVGIKCYSWMVGRYLCYQFE